MIYKHGTQIHSFLYYHIMSICKYYVKLYVIDDYLTSVKNKSSNIVNKPLNV